MKSTNSYNRIYQGRVQSVALQDPNGKLLVCEKGDDILFEHHRLFQDAVNYYLVALSAMALPSESSLFGKIRFQLKTVWEDFYRNGEKRPGLKHSIIRTLGHAELLDAPDGLDAAMKLILDGNTVNPEILNDALEYIAEKCEGDVTQPAKTYFPQLCTKFDGNYDRDAKAFLDAEGKKRLLAVIRSDSPVDEIKKIVNQMELGWCGIKTQTGKYFQGDEAKSSLRGAIQFFIDNTETSAPVKRFLGQVGKARLSEYLQRIDSLEDISFGRNNKAELNRRNAMWVLKFFPDEFSIGLMQAIIPAKETVDLGEPPRYGDDPIKLSRGNRGYVFHAFTALPIWANTWKDFDMSAFAEALKTINQFRGKMQERGDMLAKYQSALNWMNGQGTGGKPPALPDSEESTEDGDTSYWLPVLANDPRWIALQKLQKELGIQNDFTEGELFEYGLSPRTIRGFQKLRPKLLHIEQEAKDKEQLAATLKVEVAQFQTEHRDTMGSAALFMKLMEDQYSCIWHDLSNAGAYSSSDILGDAVRYYAYMEEVARLQEPIQITPADAKYSRRCSDLRALSYAQKGYKQGLGHRKDGTFAVQIAGKVQGKFIPMTVVITYSAPRLRRDGLLGESFAAYYPPAIQAFLSRDNADKQDFASTSVSLMPDWDKNDKRRILLNFAATLDVTKVQQLSNQRFLKQFLYANDTFLGLQWPSSNSKQPVTWCDSTAPFSVVSVDLGQRTAGALSRIEVSTEMRPHSVKLGEADGHTWYAYRRYSELLRLPGEDALVIRNGKRVPEYSGAEGRLADTAETEEAKDICIALVESVDLLWDRDQKIYAHFPVQNDKLLIAFRRALGRLKQLHRWVWMLSAAELQEKAQKELNECEWLGKEEKTLSALTAQAEKMREELPPLLLRIADRILPLRGRCWSWIKLEDSQSYMLKQTGIGSDDFHKKICGQRGLSFARLEQLEALRMRFQSLNRILMRNVGAEPATTSQMRNMPIPDCCPDILMRLDAMKEQRVNQTANMILAQALGLRHRVHETDEKTRLANDIHGEYEKIPGISRASFVVLENLSRYRFSQDRSAFENSRLMKWSHRQVLQKLKLLCEIFGIPVLEVNAAYSSKFSANGIPGFRAEECASVKTDEKVRDGASNAKCADLIASIRDILQKMQKIDKTATVLMPRNGGPIFVPIVPSKNHDSLPQADVNASFNIGLRALAEAANLNVNNRISAEHKKDSWKVKSKADSLKNQEIDFTHDKKLTGQGGNFFIIGCPPIWEHEKKDQPHFVNAELNRKYPYLMFGSALWRDAMLQLQRCKDINEARLSRLTHRGRHDSEL